MMLELAIGDAYGSGFEFAPDELVREHNALAGYLPHPKHRSLGPGRYTDDTQMSVAIAEAILSGQRWKPRLLAKHMVAAFKRDPREGYSSRFYAFLNEIEDENEFLQRILPNSDKSGAAMRACPIGIFDSIPTVMEYARIQAASTHDTPDGIHAAVAAALMTHYFLYRLGPRRELPEFLSKHVPGSWTTPWTGKVGTKGLECVHAALTALVRHDRMSDLLVGCVSFTGDVDTVATIAMGAASCSSEYRNDIPAHLVAGLENGAYGRDYLKNLDGQLLGTATISGQMPAMRL